MLTPSIKAGLHLSLLLLLLPGCATRGVERPDLRTLNWELHRQQLTALQAWQLNGRIAIRIDREGWSGSLSWQQYERDYQLRVTAPLGQGGFELNGGDGGVTMRTSENQILQAEDAETLLQENMGWKIPVQAFGYWVRGLPQPDAGIDTLRLDEQGRLSHLSQEGWVINYTGYLQSGGYQLPRKVLLRNGTIEVRLLVLAWGFPS